MTVPLWKKVSKKAKYLTLIEKEFSEVQYKTSRIVRRGYDHDVIILDEKIVFRFPTQNYRERFCAEVPFLNAIQSKITLPIPNYIYRKEVKGIAGYTMLKGSPLKSSLFRRLSKKKKLAIAKELGEFLSELHAIPISVAKKAGYIEPKEGQWWGKKKCTSTLRDIRTLVFPKLTNMESSWIEKQYERFLSLSFDFKPVLLHSDLSADHILVDEKHGKITGIIDFADVEFGDPATDFAGLWHYGENFVHDVLSHYTHQIDDDFLERSAFPRKIVCVPHMLECAQGKQAYLTFEENRHELQKRMKLYP